MKIAIIGSTGAVGKTLDTLLIKRSFPCKEIRRYDSKSPISFDDLDLAFFCVSSSISEKLIPIALEQGVLCIDGSSFFRMHETVPLIIPEINEDKLQTHQGVIASPNCTTTLMLLALAPLHRAFAIKRIIATTYQAVSGAGINALNELETQTKESLAGKSLTRAVFPYPIAFNLFPHESSPNEQGYVEEEQKMHKETQKILDDDSIKVSATCIRVPIKRVHCLSLNIECAQAITKEDARSLIESAPGVTLLEDWKQNRFPMPLDAAGKETIFCGRIREDHTQKNTLEMWIVGDQLLKGAALNMIQIAEALANQKA